MARLQERDTIVLAFLDRLSTNFEERRGEILPADAAGAGAYQVDSASERIRLDLDRSRASGKWVGRPPALRHEQVEQCRRMAGEDAGLRRIARVMDCSPATVEKALGLEDE